jgi:uroporphyrinogen III methyltransferase / synthase
LAREKGAERAPGRVYLVGAGPGDPGLLTRRALELIGSADVILYDRLIPAQALDGARDDAELLYVGKEGAGAAVPQAEIEQLIVERALAGLEVVRLKGGDPFVFGRGGEEALALRRAGVPFEVVPGVSAGVAAPAYAGVPVTHRGRSSAVAFVTGHTRAEPATGLAGSTDGAISEEEGGEQGPELDWEALASFPGTLVFYMGARALKDIARSLIGAGRRPTEPVVVIERGTLPEQRTVAGTLHDIAERAAQKRIRAPSITVVGDVAELAGELGWLPRRPLSGVTVAVTRAREQASELARELSELGARVVQAPAIKIRPLEGPPLDPKPFQLLCLMSANGVGVLFERLRAGGRDARSLAGIRIAAVGSGTARALLGHGIDADVVAERSLAEGLLEALGEAPVSRALIVQALHGRDVLARALRERGAEVDVMEAYETVAEPLSPQVLAAARGADYLTFTSSSTVRFFLEAGDGQRGLSAATRIVSIGPVTSATLREHGLEPHVEAARHDVEGVVEALVGDAQDRAQERR